MADKRPEPLLNGKALSSLRVVDLKQELEKRGISKSGTKKDLVDKLRTRLELESMQTPAVGEEGGGQVPNLCLKDEEPNDFVKAYLAEQQQSYQKQIEIRQQVISESDVPAGADMSEAVADTAPVLQPVDQAEDLSPKKQTRAPRTPRTSVSESSPQPARKSLRSQSITTPSASEDIPASHEEEVLQKMPAAEPETSPASSAPPPVSDEPASRDTTSPGSLDPVINATGGSEEGSGDVDTGSSAPAETTQSLAPDALKEQQKEELKQEVAEVPPSGTVPAEDEPAAPVVESIVPVAAEPAEPSGSQQVPVVLAQLSVQQDSAVPPASVSEADESAEASAGGSVKQSVDPCDIQSALIQLPVVSDEVEPKAASKADGDGDTMETPVQHAVAEAIVGADHKAESKAGGDGDVSRSDPDDSAPAASAPRQSRDSARKSEGSPRKSERDESSRKTQASPARKSREEASPQRRALREVSERRRLATDRKDEAGDEAKAKPKRKWGSGSERQISRGISSTQLNSLLPKKEKVSVGSQEECQGEGSAAESITMSGKFSQPANGSLVSNRLPADQGDNQEVETQKPVNGQSTAGVEVTATEEVGAARNPVSNVLFIENLTRPFTLPALHALLKTFGSIDTSKFWTDKIKSMCLVAYASPEEAEAARTALYGIRWPSSNPKKLVADFSTEEEIELRKKEADKPIAVQQASVAPANDKYDITIRKTFGEEKENSSKPVRDWDRDKVSQASPPPSKRPRRSPSPLQLTEQKSGSRLTPEQECPAKLLDDLFKKTSSSPIIYWLPLNEEEAESRAKLRDEREKRRQDERTAREALRQTRRSPPPARLLRSPRGGGRGGYRGGPRDRSRSMSRSRSRSPIRQRDAGRYRSPPRRR